MREDGSVKPAERRYAGPVHDELPEAANGAPLTLIGYWEGESERGWPRVTDFVDERWDETERDLVASYLEHGFVPWAGLGVSPCRMCGAPNGSAELTDGVYVWPEGLAHYVQEHRVRLPVSVIRHIVGRLAGMDAWRVDQDWWRTATLDS
jgi:hypothetical protein